MSLLCLDAMPSHARRAPSLPRRPPTPPPSPPAPSCVSPLRLVVDDCNGVAAIKWQPTFVGKQRGSCCSEWQGGERRIERWQVEGRREVCSSFYSLKWQAAVAHTTRSMATLAEDAARGEHAHKHTNTHTHRRTRRELTHCCRWAGECMCVCVCVSKSHLRKLRGNKC